MKLDRRRVLIGLGVAAGVFLVAALVLWQRCGLKGCPDVDLLAGYSPEEASVVVDRDGEEVAKLYLVQRTVVPLDSLPEYVAEAFVATEDQRFWDHGGVDWRRVPGALIANVKAGGVEEGFSTITMQLARNIFPDKLPASQRTVWRKLGEMRVAGEIEDRYGKEEILQMYLNQIYFGSGAWGIQAAAQEYFGKSAAELTLAEAALLAGLPTAPSRNNPRNDRDLALKRRDLVLRRMEAQGLITAAEASEAREAELELAQSLERATENAPYFVEAVRQRLEEQLGDIIYTEGLTIHTTLDLDVQRIAEQELEQQLAAIESGRYGAFRHTVMGAEDTDSDANFLQGSLVTMDARTGDVLAMVGGRDFDQSKYNRALQAKRQPGSAFKPFVYATAIARGYPPTYPLDDTPLRMTIDGRTWEPKNYGDSYGGRVTMRQALVNSKNVATIRLAERVGLGGVINTAHALGIDEEIPEYPSIALGSAEVTLIEIVSAYAAFANLGTRPQPRVVTRVVDRSGNTVWQEASQARQVIDPAVAYLVTDMLQDVVDRGTATAVRAVGYRGPVAGKTGTTNEGSDAWFVGFTPEIVTGVWIGLDDPAPIVRGATGGTLAAPVWGRVMRQAGFRSGDWSPPPGVEAHQIDAQGNLVVEGCPAVGAVQTEYFLAGTVAGAASCYQQYAYDDAYGDSIYGYDYGDEAEEDGESWFDRLRRRLFADEEQPVLDELERRAARDTLDLDEVDAELERRRAERDAPLPELDRRDRDSLERRDSARIDRPARRPPPPAPDDDEDDEDDDSDLLGEPVRPDTTGAR